MASLVDPRALVLEDCPFFEWWEFSGSLIANAERLERARRLVRELLCPLRRAKGRVTVTSWYTWSSGQPRDSVHGLGAGVDFVPDDVPLREAYEWLRDRTYYGELLLELDHIHATLPGFGGNMQALIETAPGSFEADPAALPAGTLITARAGLGSPGAVLLLSGATYGLWRLAKRGAAD